MNNAKLKQAYLDHLKHIKLKDCSLHAKNQLIEGLIDRLRFIHNNPELMALAPAQNSIITNSPSPKKSLFAKKQTHSENHSTSYSFYSDNSEIPSPQDYEQKIMEKRLIKFEINQEIEALQDDLFEIDKVVETKRLFNDELAKNITKRMKDIGENTKTPKEDSFLSKTATKFNKKDDRPFDLNATVSGASGFGFATKRKQTHNVSLNTSINSSLNTSFTMHKTDMSLGQITPEETQRKKARSNISKSITGIFKNILK